jgi:uncharacterized protein YuzE
MIIQYFEDTDNLYITFFQKSPKETGEIDENTIRDLDECLGLGLKITV